MWILGVWVILHFFHAIEGGRGSSSELKLLRDATAKTSIVTYKKQKLTENKINELMESLKKDCRCTIRHLKHVGAFVLTYTKRSHMMVKNIKLDKTVMAACEDGIVKINNDDVLDLGDQIEVHLDNDNETISIDGVAHHSASYRGIEKIDDEKSDHAAITKRQIPNDPLFNFQWALKNLNNNADINAQDGWDEYLSDSQGGNPNGPSVIVAVLDTGIDYNHPDLANRMWQNPDETPNNGIDDDGNGIIDDIFGADFSGSNAMDGDPMDGHGHGTHCAGIIGAEHDNGIGIAGVASFTQDKVKMMAVKGLSNSGSGTLSGMLNALDYALSKGAKISSNSWGTSGWSNTWDAPWSMVLQNNPQHIFVAAAGNQDQWMDQNNKKMACGLDEPNLLCVASSTKLDRKSCFSNDGKDFVHVFAPGSSIYSTWLNNGYRSLSGTSMACPHASGLAALIMTMNGGLDGAEVRTLIEDNVQPKPYYECLVSSGGLIDMKETIIAAKNPGKRFDRLQYIKSNLPTNSFVDLSFINIVFM